MKIRNRTMIFFILFAVIFLHTFTFVEASKTTSASGEWTKVEYTSECFPLYEDFNIFIKSTGKIVGFEDLYNDTVIYIKGYSITINKTQIAYVNYDDVEDYIPPGEIRHIFYEPGEFNITELGFGYHRLTMQIFAGTIDPNNIVTLPDEYLVFETFFDQEILFDEWLTITLTVVLPLGFLGLAIFLRYFLDKQFIENVTFPNMLSFAKRFVKEFAQTKLSKIIIPFARACAHIKAKRKLKKEAK